MKTFIVKQDIIERIKVCKNLKNDADLARFLGISPATLSNWRSRGSIDYDLVFSKCEHSNLDWLLTGRGEMLPTLQGMPHKETPTNDNAALLSEKDARIVALEKTIASQERTIDLLEEKIVILKAPPVVPVVRTVAAG